MLVITSPFSWSDEYTDRANWLGGVFKDGAPARSEDCLRAVLAGLDLEVGVRAMMPARTRIIIRVHAFLH